MLKALDNGKFIVYYMFNVGRAFYHAYMNFIKDPENERMIEKRADEIRKIERVGTCEDAYKAITHGKRKARASGARAKKRGDIYSYYITNIGKINSF